MGMLTLSGTADDRRAKVLAERVAKSIRGVTDVQNQLRIRRTQAATDNGAKAPTSTDTTSGTIAPSSTQQQQH